MGDIIITEILCGTEVHDDKAVMEIDHSGRIDLEEEQKRFMMPFMKKEINRNMNKVEMIVLIGIICKLLIRRLLGIY
jgi:hypothetical protein